MHTLTAICFQVCSDQVSLNVRWPAKMQLARKPYLYNGLGISDRIRVVYLAVDAILRFNVEVVQPNYLQFFFFVLRKFNAFSICYNIEK